MNKPNTDFVDAIAYRLISRKSWMIDEYVQFRVKQKPWWLPEFIYEFLLKNLIELCYFEKIINPILK